jgi:integrase
MEDIPDSLLLIRLLGEGLEDLADFSQITIKRKRRCRVFMEKLIVLDYEGYAISFENIKRLIDFFPYGDEHRIAIELLALTGMRTVELDGISPANFWTDTNKNTFLIWKLGKNQSGTRKELVPEWFLEEVRYFLTQSFRMPHRPLFSFRGEALRYYINHFVRHRLRGDWIKKRPGHRGFINGEYVLQLKGLRHTFATKVFYEALNRFGAEVGAGIVQARMQHHSPYITCRHYTNDIQTIFEDLEHFKGASIGEILRHSNQIPLTAYL